MNPQHYGKQMYGVTCTESGNECIYIGARLLLDEGLKLTVHGTLAHEMLHQAVNMRYRNACKPYEKNDEVRAKEYKKVMRDTLFRHPIDDLFERALRNPGGPNVKEAELIVRPVHAKALYANDEAKVKELEWNYPEIHDFYRKRVLPDIEQALKDAHEKAKELQKKHNVPMDADDVEYFENIRKLKRKQRLLWFGSILALLAVSASGCFFYFWMTPMNQIETINDEFFSGFEYLQLTDEAVRSFNLSVDANNQVLHIKSNSVVMTILAIHQLLAIDNSLWKSFFVNFNDVTDEMSGKKFWKLHESLLYPTMIVNCSGIDAPRLSNYIGTSSSDRIILVSENSPSFDNFSSIELSHSWSQLTSATQQRIFGKMVTFQGCNSTIGDIFKTTEIGIGEKLRRIVTSEKTSIKIGGKLKQFDLYVNRTLEIAKNRFSFDKFYGLNQQSQVLLLSDSPGNGKSTEMEMIAWRLKQKDPWRWVLYFDLKKYTGAFNTIKSFEASTDVAKFIGRDMLKFDDFELEFFVGQFESGLVILLMDGVDEIAPKHTELFIELMENIQEQSENQLWIATRPHMQKVLEKSLDFTVFKLQDLDKQKQREFFAKAFQELSKQGRTKTNETEFTSKSMLILSGVEMWSSPIANPMILGMIVTLLFNDHNFDLDKANSYAIYDDFTTQILTQLLDKGEDAKKDMVTLMKTGQAMKFHQKIAINQIDDLQMPFSMSYLPNLLPHEMARIGFAYNDSNEVYFVHKTFSEFFLAKYYVETIFEITMTDKESFEDAMHHVFELGGVSNAAEFNVITSSFVNSALEDKTISTNYKAFQSFFDEHEKEMMNSFYHLAEGGEINIAKARLRSGETDDLRIQHMALKGATAAGLLEHVTSLWHLIEKHSNRSQIREMFLIESEDEPKTLMNYAISARNHESEFKVLDFLSSKVREYFNETESDQVFLPKTPLWCAQFYFNISIFKRNLSERQFKMFLESKNLKGENMFHYSVSEFGLMAMKRFSNQSVNEVGLKQLKSFYLDRNYKKENIVMGRLQNVRDDFFSWESFWSFLKEVFNDDQIKALLTDEDLRGYNALYYAFKNSPIARKTFTKFYKEIFGDDKLKQAIIETIRRTLKNHRQTPSYTNHEVLRHLRTSLNLSDAEILFGQTRSEGQAITANCQLETPKEFEFWWFTLEFSPVDSVKVLLESCRNQENFLENLATTKTESQQNILMIVLSNKKTFEYLLSRSDHETQRRLLTETDSRGWNVLRNSFELMDDDFDFIFETYENILGKREFEKALTEIVDDLFVDFDSYKSEAVFESMTKYLDIELIATLTKHDRNARNLLCLYLIEQSEDGTSNGDAKRFECLSLIPKTCDWFSTFRMFKSIQRNIELQSVLNHRNVKNQTIFDVLEARGDQATAVKLRRNLMEKH
jgi:hypothetical protein